METRWEFVWYTLARGIVLSDSGQTNSYFPQTLWTLVRRVNDVDGTEREKALTRLVEVYWPPVYSYLRRSGQSQDDATEITQAFFADIILERGLLETADQNRGRLRALLVTALKRFIIDRHRRVAARSPSNGVVLAIDKIEQEEVFLAGRGADPEDAFDKRWALVQIAEALRRCETHFRDAGRVRHWQAFDARLLRPAVSMAAPPPLAKLALELGFASAADTAAAVQVVKKRFEAYLREVVAETTADGDDQELEYRHLVSMFA